MPDKKPKILIATGIYPPDIGGPATYCKLLFEELPKRGFEVEILSFGGVRHLPKIIRHAVYFLKVLRRGRSADIIYAQDPVSVGLPAVLAAKILGRKFIIRVAGDYAWEQGSQRFGVTENLDDFTNNHLKKKPFWVKVFRSIQEFVARQAVAVIVPSKYLGKIVSHWGINPEKISIVYNAFTETSPTETKEALRKSFNWSGPVLISVGRLVPWKGFSSVIKVVSGLKKTYPEIKLVIVGDGPDKNKLLKETQLVGDGAVEFWGKVSRPELLKLLKAADVLVLSTSYEGFSHLLLETMSVKTPVVTTKVGGNVELITDKENGLLVDYNDEQEISLAIEELITQPTLARSLVGQAKVTVSGFSNEKMFGETVRVFRKFI